MVGARSRLRDVALQSLLDVSIQPRTLHYPLYLSITYGGCAAGAARTSRLREICTALLALLESRTLYYSL